MHEQYLKDNTGGLVTLFSKDLRRQRIKMDKAFVAESIGNQYTEWNARNPVFIAVFFMTILWKQITLHIAYTFFAVICI